MRGLFLKQKLSKIDMRFFPANSQPMTSSHSILMSHYCIFIYPSKRRLPPGKPTVCNSYIMGSTAAGGRARATPRISNHCLRGFVAPCWISGVMTCYYRVTTALHMRYYRVTHALLPRYYRVTTALLPRYYRVTHELLSLLSGSSSMRTFAGRNPGPKRPPWPLLPFSIRPFLVFFVGPSFVLPAYTSLCIPQTTFSSHLRIHTVPAVRIVAESPPS